MTKKDIPLAKIKNRYWLLLSVIVLGYAVLQAAIIPMLPLSYDDGLNLQISQLINRGYAPYTQIFTLANPLFVWFVGWLGQSGLSPTGFKLVFLLFGLLFLVNTAVISQILLGKRVALATVFLLATATTFLAESATTIVAITPAMSIATLSLVFTLRYCNTKRLIWLPLAGAVWSVALFMSVSVLSTGLMALFLIAMFETGFIFQPGQTRTPAAAEAGQNSASSRPKVAKRVFKNVPSSTLNRHNIYKIVGLWLAGGLISLGVGLFLATPDIVFGHVLTNQALLRENIALAQTYNFRLFGQFMGRNIWLSLLAAYSLSRIYEKANHPLWLVLIWGLVSFAWLMLQVNLRLLDIAIILPALAIIAGWGLVDLGSRLLDRSRNWHIDSARQRLRQFGIGIMALLIYLWITGLQINRFNLREIDSAGDLIQLEQRQTITDFIRRHSQPQDCVIIDDPALAIAANRLPAPQLVDLSRAQIKGGFISEEALEAMTRNYECAVIVFSKREYSRPLSKFKEWAKTYYPNEQRFIRTDIYYQ